MILFLPTGPIGKLLQWLDEHHVFLLLSLFGILLSAGMLAYARFRTPPVPEPFTLEAEKGDYCCMDVQLLSDWLLKTGGSAADQFYLAVGTDETLCIISMNDVIHERFDAVAEYGADSADITVRAEGMVKQLSRENRELLMEALGLTDEEYTALLGNRYLDLRDDPNGTLRDVFVYVLGASLVLLAVNAVVAFDDRRERRRRHRADREGT